MAYGHRESNGHVINKRHVTPVGQTRDPSTPIVEPNISKKAGFRDSVPKYSQYEMAYENQMVT